MLTKVYVETKSNHRHHQALPISKILINRVLLAGFRWSAPQWEMGLESGLFWVLQVEIGFCTANTRHCHATRRSNLHLTQNSKNFLKTIHPSVQYHDLSMAEMTKKIVYTVREMWGVNTLSTRSALAVPPAPSHRGRRNGKQPRKLKN